MLNLKFIKDYYLNNSVKLLVSIVFFVLALIIFAVITDEIILEKEETVDFLVFNFLQYMVSDKLTGYMYVITQFSSVSFMKIAYPLLIGALLIFKFYRKAVFTIFSGLGGLLLVYGMKIFFQRPRPPYPLFYKEESFSFPSGHATSSFILYGMLAYFVWLTDLPKVGKYTAMTFLIMLSLTIGFSRVYLRVHYASDVLGGFCLGYSWLFLMIYIFRKWFPLN